MKYTTLSVLFLMCRPLLNKRLAITKKRLTLSVKSLMIFYLIMKFLKKRGNLLRTVCPTPSIASAAMLQLGFSSCPKQSFSCLYSFSMEPTSIEDFSLLTIPNFTSKPSTYWLSFIFYLELISSFYLTTNTFVTLTVFSPYLIPDDT